MTYTDGFQAYLKAEFHEADDVVPPCPFEEGTAEREGWERAAQAWATGEYDVFQRMERDPEDPAAYELVRLDSID